MSLAVASEAVVKAGAVVEKAAAVRARVAAEMEAAARERVVAVRAATVAWWAADRMTVSQPAGTRPAMFEGGGCRGGRLAAGEPQRSRSEAARDVLDLAMEVCRRSLALCERRLAKKLREMLPGLLFFRRHEREHACGELGMLREVASHSVKVG